MNNLQVGDTFGFACKISVMDRLGHKTPTPCIVLKANIDPETIKYKSPHYICYKCGKCNAIIGEPSLGVYASQYCQILVGNKKIFIGLQ